MFNVFSHPEVVIDVLTDVWVEMIINNFGEVLPVDSWVDVDIIVAAVAVISAPVSYSTDVLVEVVIRDLSSMCFGGIIGIGSRSVSGDALTDMNVDFLAVMIIALEYAS